LVALSVVICYLIAGLGALLIGYRAAGVAARRKLRLIVAGSGAGFFNLLLIIVWEAFFRARFPQAGDWMEVGLKFTLPLIPLSFAYAIVRHQVIPISLIIRRGVRYVLVSRGSVLLEALVVFVTITALLTYVFSRINPPGIVIGVVSAGVGILVWRLEAWLHNKYLAPVIDRHFFRESYNSQQIITDLTNELRTVTGLPHLLELVSTKIQSALKTENVTIFLRDGQTGDYLSGYSCEYSAGNAKPVARDAEFRLPHSASVVGKLADAAAPVEVESGELISARSNGHRPAAIERETLREMNSALLLPLTTNDGMVGLVSLGPRLGDLPFSRDDKHLLMSVAGPATFAIENAQLVGRMIEEARRREEIEAENQQRAKELEEARQLQLSMLPKSVPQLPGLEIAAYMKTAAEVGGDYYDFHLSSGGTLTVAVGDATGHGLKAGTVVTAMKSLFHCFADEPELLPVMNRSSHVLKQMNLRSLFMGLTVIKLRGRRLKISSAGMPPMLIYRAKDRAVEEVLIKAMPLGSITGYTYREQELSVSYGDVVVLMSDGLPERFNLRDEMFDYWRATGALAEVAEKPPHQIIEHLVRAGDAWADGRPQDDDVTFVVLKVK
jgi:serine phosphatase RsbU (regulator of sigma subunit)